MAAPVPVCRDERLPSDLRDTNVLQELSERGGGPKAWSALREVLRKGGDLRPGNLRDDEQHAPAGLARHGEAAISSTHWPALDET